MCPQTANAGTASKIADKTIEYTAKGVYYVTKYTLKGGWFVAKKTAKGIKVVSVSLFNATKDAFSENKRQPTNTKPANYYENRGTLPPPPVLEE